MKLKNPVTFSHAFGVTKKALKKVGVLDCTLNLDTPLFIDPLLLATSKHAEMRNAKTRFDQHFATVVKLLSASKNEGDVAWRNARRQLAYHEVSGTCLGYGTTSTRGSGFGDAITGQVLATAKQIVDIGVTDPELFMVMALFEEGIGADRISDMTTNIILPNLIAFNERVLPLLGVPLEEFKIRGKVVKLPKANLPGGYLLLVPTDVLRDLPIAKDWDDISSVAAANDELRETINKQIGDVWAIRTRKDKAEFRQALLSNRKTFESFLEAIKGVPKNPYDIDADPKGLVKWTEFVRMVVSESPLDLAPFSKRVLSIEDVREVVVKIVSHYKGLVENKGLWKEFWAKGRSRPEKSAQLLFFAIADSYCKAYELDLTPEADSNNGPVDFKISSGYTKRFLVELKLSTNTRLLSGYSTQLERYKLGEDTEHAIYLVIDLGNSGDKAEKLTELRNKMVEKGKRPSDIVIVDASARLSASKA